MFIFLRTEGNLAQGMGDVEGCLALAEAFPATVHPLFLISGGQAAINAIQSRGFSCALVNNWQEEQMLIVKHAPEAMVVNMLNNNPNYIAALSEMGLFVVTIDDNGPAPKHAHLNINPLYAHPLAISDLALVPLRQSFRDANRQIRTIPPIAKRLLVTQGGSDTHGFMKKILAAIQPLVPSLEITVIIGPTFGKDPALNHLLANQPAFRVLRNVSNMTELMMDTDIAITAGGLTMCELACCGVPQMVVCAETWEEETAQRVEKAGAAINFGFGGRLNQNRMVRQLSILVQDQKARIRMSLAGKALVDGQGSCRMAQLILAHIQRRLS